MTTKSKYAHFYALLHKMGLSAEDRRDFLMDYTNGLYASLSEMHDRTPNFYYQMLRDMQSAIDNQKKDVADMWRKRVIAAIIGFHKQIGRSTDIDYIKATACRATSYTAFNSIPVSRLQNIYSMYVNKQNDFKRMSKEMRNELANSTFLN
ncbi:hypothetical protein [Saccharicrinis fermentans]|uniref:Uncharacterized protein n=1 Tax=Saccharicrinis fermentans DSM 9555 = JCM 21142 TaxID=869213 RepID=W7YTN1_9BACT|nr:hypothetical protein [Saccharicrinis fermentans]GAF05814.1 hypothetical protein JCM21142_114568 [Saccharicrinis fermentans DSM 9555 = JCM 21142]